MNNLQDVRLQGDQGQSSLYSSIVHLYLDSPRNKDPIKQVHLEVSL